jgi:hypothetical protein
MMKSKNGERSLILVKPHTSFIYFQVLEYTVLVLIFIILHLLVGLRAIFWLKL